jgi:hypothetical protein
VGSREVSLHCNRQEATADVDQFFSGNEPEQPKTAAVYNRTPETAGLYGGSQSCTAK